MKKSELITDGPFMIPYASEWQGLRSPEMTVSASAGDTNVRFVEEMRTGATLYAQENIHMGDKAHWEKLTQCQPESVRLMPSEYRELTALSREVMPDAEMYEAMQFINLVHDTGKNSDMMRAVDLNPSHDSHDEGLRRLFLPDYRHALEQFLPSYTNPAMFTNKQQRTIEGVLTADFNFARFMQSQVSQEEIDQLATIPSDILAAIVLHGIHDIGGAMGHKNLTSSLTLDSPTVNRMLDAAHGLLGSAEDLGCEPSTIVTPTMRHAAYLDLRAYRFGITLPEDASDIEKSEYVARIDIASLLKCNTSEEFATIDAAYNAMPELLRTCWAINQAASFTIYGSGHPIKKYGSEYLPAFLRSALKKGDVQTTYEALGYFSQVLNQAMAYETIEASKAGLDYPLTSTYDQINFYHLTKWFSKNKLDGTNDSVSIIYKCTGRTLTPIPVDESYEGIEPRYALVHPDKFKVNI